LTADESGVLADFTVLFNGVMVGAEMSRQSGAPAIVTVTCDQDLGKVRHAPLRLIDHQFYFPTDTASTFINDLARGAKASAVERSEIYEGIREERRNP
jgi:ethanolamine utilization cobalamin adenosyltransferase